MDLGSKIFIVGHSGLIGSAIYRKLQTLGYGRLLLRRPDDLDLTRQEAVEELFGWEQPDYVFLATASAAGAVADSSSSADLLYQDLATELNIMSTAYRAGTKRLLFLGSSTIYPRLSEPLRETSFLPGHLGIRERAYAIAKMAGVELCNTYNRDHGCRFLAVMPSNSHGSGHSYELHNSDLIPSMILAMHQAKITGQHEMVLENPANLRRGFLYSDELADACVSLMNLPDPDFDALVSSPSGPLINIGCEEDFTMRQLAEMVAEVVKFKGKVLFAGSNPDDRSPEVSNLMPIETFRWRSPTSFKDRLRRAYRDLLLHTDASEWAPSDDLQLFDAQEKAIERIS
jgi:GDP-L-fucose synthase